MSLDVASVCSETEEATTDAGGEGGARGRGQHVS